MTDQLQKSIITEASSCRDTLLNFVYETPLTEQDGGVERRKEIKANVELVHLASQLKNYQAGLVLSFAKTLFGSESSTEGSPFDKRKGDNMNTQKQDYIERVKKYQQRPKYEGFGESHHLREWARLLNIPAGSLSRYLHNGLTIEESAEVRGIIYEPKK